MQAINTPVRCSRARKRPCWNAGVAAIEFAIAAPAVMVLLGGVVDAGLMARSKIRLAGAVSAGVQYATLAGSGVNPSVVRNVVTASSMLPGVTGATTGPACYCPVGAPATLSPISCSGTCSGGGPAGLYLQVSATYAYQPLVPGLSHLLPSVIAESATVRLQ